MKTRAQLKHLLLDVGFRTKPKIIDLEAEFGPLGRLLLIDVYTAMSVATDAKISINVIRSAARWIGFERCDEFVAYCQAHGIIERDGEHFTNSRVIKDQESYGKRLEYDRKRKGFRSDSVRNATRNPDGIPTDSDIDIVYDLDLDPDLKDLKSNGHPPEFEIPIASLDTPEVRSALALWAKHLSKLKKPLHQISIEALLAQHSGRPQELVDAIHHSVANNWRTLVSKPTGDPPRARGSPAERTMATARAMLERELEKERQNDQNRHD